VFAPYRVPSVSPARSDDKRGQSDETEDLQYK
jgi:hypothetical protein